MSSVMNDEPITTLKRSHNVNIENITLGKKGSVTSLQTITDDKLPGVNFVMIYYIRAYLGHRYSFELISLKTPSKVARWTISIEEKRCGNCVNQTCNWNDIVRLQIQPLFPGYYGASTVGFDIGIKWYGFMENLPSSILYHNMKCFYASSTLSDFVISIDDKEIPVHKLVLAAQSPVFLAMFETDMMESKEKKIIIKDIQIDIMKKVIEFLYTGEIDAEVDVAVIFAILSVAIKYQIMNLKYYCIAIVTRKLDVNNIFQVVEKSCFHTIPELIKSAMDFTIKNQAEVIKLKNLESSLSTSPEYWAECFRLLVKGGN